MSTNLLGLGCMGPGPGSTISSTLAAARPSPGPSIPSHGPARAAAGPHASVMRMLHSPTLQRLPSPNACRACCGHANRGE